MNEEKVNKLLDLIIVGVEKGSEFATTQVSAISEEIINLSFYTNVMWVSVFILMLLICLGVGVICGIRFNREHNDGNFIASFISMILFVFFFTGTCYHVQDLTEVIVAPKLHVVKYVKRMK